MKLHDIELVWKYIILGIVIEGTILQNLREYANEVGTNLVIHAIILLLICLFFISMSFLILVEAVTNSVGLFINWFVFSIFLSFAALSKFTNLCLNTEFYLLCGLSFWYITYVYEQLNSKY